MPTGSVTVPAAPGMPIARRSTYMYSTPWPRCLLGGGAAEWGGVRLGVGEAWLTCCRASGHAGETEEKDDPLCQHAARGALSAQRGGSSSS